MRLLRELKNKDSMLYSEVIKAINKFNNGELKYTVSKKYQKKNYQL